MLTEAAPGVLRRRWTLGLTALRALEAWKALDPIGQPMHWPTLRQQVRAEFAHARRRR